MIHQPSRAIRGCQPIYCQSNRLILLRGSGVYQSDLDLSRFERICDLPLQKEIERLPARVLRRIFRLGADSAAEIGSDHLLIARRNIIYRVSLSQGTCEIDLVIPGGARVLHLSEIRDPFSGEQAICFGEYSTRFDGGPINVWRRGTGPSDHWALSGTFPAGEIDHVHNICQTRDGSIHVLTGDFGGAAAIWKTDFELSSFTPLARGSQGVRACWLWQAPDGGRYFATDSQLETNRLRRIDGDEIEDVAEIIGSSIHFHGDASRLIFSSTVEPGAPTGRRFRDIFDRTPGPGIKANAAAIYLFEHGRLQEIYRETKDAWPMRLAQFGTFQFPAGTMPPDRFYAYGVGVKPSDGHCLCFRR